MTGAQECGLAVDVVIAKGFAARVGSKPERLAVLGT